MTLKISLLTPVYNRAAVIAQAVESVVAQAYPAVEHIILDGGSTDGTLAVLARYPHVRVHQQADSGMYDALNRGLAMAQGEIIGFLNSDDVYRPGAFDAILRTFQRHPRADAVAGRAEYFLERPSRPPWVFRRTQRLTPTNLWRELIYGDPAFNAWFFRRRVFERLGGFDPVFRIAGDREFLWRFALAGLQVIGIPQVVYAYRVHADSLSLSTQAAGFLPVADEVLRLAQAYRPRLPAEAQTWLRRALVRDTITAASRSLRRGKWRLAWHYARLGTREARTWPLRFMWRLLGGGYRWLGRRLGWYPPL